MCKRFVSLVLSAVLACSLVAGMVPAADAAAAPSYTASIVWTDAAKGMSLNGKVLSTMPLMNVNGVPYCSVKYFFENCLASAKVYWANYGSNVKGTTASGESLVILAQPGAQYMQVNGQSVYVPNGIKILNGLTMVPIEQLAAVFQGSACSYDWGSNVYVVVTGAYLAGSAVQPAVSYQPDASSSSYYQPAATAASYSYYQPSGYYDPQALDLIARVINTEAGSMSLEGKVSVGNVIMNRVASPEFPNTVYGVIYQRNQFTVINSARFQLAPSEASLTAAKMALDGVNYVPGAMFYNVSGMRTWASRNRSYLMTFAGHDFYR